MSIVRLAGAALVAGALASCQTKDDALSRQLERLNAEGRASLVAQEAARRGLTQSEVAGLRDPAARNDLAMDLATRRGILDVAEGKLATGAPKLQERAQSLAARTNPVADLKGDPTLQVLTEGYRWKARDLAAESSGMHTEMINPAGKTKISGACHPGDISLLNEGSTYDPAKFAQEKTANAFPDPKALPFSICFVVELRIGDGREVHCSGALVGRDLVLTARHCLLDQSNQLLQDASKIQVRSVNGGQIVTGTGSTWEAAEAGYEDKRDVALIKLSSALFPTAPTAYGRVALGTEQTLWVLLAGVGTTDKVGINLKDWNSGFVSYPQPVDFGSVIPSDRRTATIRWSKLDATSSSSCAGDSGGPVVVVSRTNEPLVVGVLSEAPPLAQPGTPVGCAKSYGGTFVALGHPYVSMALCAELANRGYPCATGLDYVVRLASR